MASKLKWLKVWRSWSFAALVSFLILLFFWELLIVFAGEDQGHTFSWTTYFLGVGIFAIYIQVFGFLNFLYEYNCPQDPLFETLPIPRSFAEKVFCVTGSALGWFVIPGLAMIFLYPIFSLAMP